jgi:glycylpeptide N-tetradecanoyltransferase
MPTGFEWCSLDITNPDEALEVYNLLNENYVEDDDAMFRFDYSVPFLQWALTQPGYLRDWHVGVRNSKTKVLMGCITAVPVDVRVYDKVQHMAEINFLCVHKKLRTKRLAPVLIKEITRRVNQQDRWQAVYTAGIVLPKPVGRCRYYHRSLNPKKLIEVRFSSLPPKMTLAKHLKNLKLAKKPVNAGLRPMEPADVPGVQALLTNYLNNR